jgi:hypothetical protein
MELDTLDVLKEKWAEHDRKLDAVIRLNRRILMAANLNRARSPLLRFAFFVGCGALIGLTGCAILGQFIYRHWAEPRFALAAAVLDVWVIATVAAAIRQMTMALLVDYSKPVAVIQKQLESLRLLRIRIIQWALLTGQVVWWAPFLIVALEGFWGVDAYKAFGAVYLAANLAVGLAMIPLAILVSRRFAGRMGGSPIVQRLMRELAGYNLNTAAAFLADLSEFENETNDK